MRKPFANDRPSAGGRFPALKQLTKDDLLLRIKHDKKVCGHPGDRIELAVWVDDSDKWMPIAFISGQDLHAAVDLLTQATKHLDTLRVAEFASWPVDD